MNDQLLEDGPQQKRIGLNGWQRVDDDPGPGVGDQLGAGVEHVVDQRAAVD